ncbi:hypothetical protein Taro_053050 [Colocasia esculenta]|uniref:Uncharacterized protein n=1 Tax=Colocasia esculenta TaxID=4460 RepID=A0A843XM06_COLES|nr:hypothetical protein [Colocasia esculenta]
MDERSSCRSTKLNKNCGDQPNHHTCSRTTTLLESEGVQEDDKTLTVPLYRDKPRAPPRAWLTSEPGAPN